MSKAPQVSVIVIFDRGEFEPCLSSLTNQSGVDFEIVAVAPEESSGCGRPLPAVSKVVQFLPIKDRNPALRRNAAAALARGKYLAFIDDDATAPADWLRHGVEYLEQHENVVGLGGPNLCPEDPGLGERLTDMLLTTPYIGAGSRAYLGGGELAPALPGEIHLVNFIVRREWFERVGGLNEGLGYGGEDTEFLYLTGKLGAEYMFDPDLVVRHRRRAFMVDYAKQRFKLRRQSAKLFVAYPDVYSRNRSFIAALASAPASFLLGASCFYLFDYFSLIYLAVVFWFMIQSFAFSTMIDQFAEHDPHRRHRGPWTITGMLYPGALAVHLFVNLAGLWFGLFESILTGPWRLRRRIKRDLMPNDA